MCGGREYACDFVHCNNVFMGKVLSTLFLEFAVFGAGRFVYLFIVFLFAFAVFRIYFRFYCDTHTQTLCITVTHV